MRRKIIAMWKAVAQRLRGSSEKSARVQWEINEVRSELYQKYSEAFSRRDIL